MLHDALPQLDTYVSVQAEVPRHTNIWSDLLALKVVGPFFLGEKNRLCQWLLGLRPKRVG